MGAPFDWYPPPSSNLSTSGSGSRAVVQTLAADKADDEVDIFTDAALNGTEAAIAWTSPDLPFLNGSRHIANTYGLAEEAELFGILGAIQAIRDHSDAVTHRKFRIITDSHVALRELNRAFSLNHTATNILHVIRDIETESFTIRVAWTPGHTNGAQGTRSAHAAARERLHTPPTATSTPPSLPVQPDWQVKLPKLKTGSRQRLRDATPAGILSPLKALTRPGEIMANNIYANSALTPHIVHKWTAPTSFFPQHCPYGNTRCTPNLFHFLWKCCYFSDGRARLVSDSCPPASEAEHLQ